MLTPAVVGEHHYNVAQGVRTALAEYEDLKDIISMLGMEELSQRDRETVNKARRLERFLTQPFFTTEQFTGVEGRRVELEDAIRGCERILDGEFAEFGERALYMIGGVDEAQKKRESEARNDEEEKAKTPGDETGEPENEGGVGDEEKHENRRAAKESTE
jgi:F-type H+-transporting ATPase subunit beta